MTYNIWNIQAITGQYQNQPSGQRQPDAAQGGFIKTLLSLMVQNEAPTVVAASGALPQSFVFPHMREVHHVDLDSYSSKKKVHEYIA